MRTDWYAEMNWRLVALGVFIGILTPALLTGLIVRAGLVDDWVLMLLFTELSVILEGFVTALGAGSRTTRLVHGVVAVLICAAFSFVIGVAVDPGAGSNLGGDLLSCN